jgi:hypothetical protein
MYQCENLRFLDLTRNQLLTIDDQFANMAQLKELRLVNAGPGIILTEKLCELRFLEYLQIDRYTQVPNCLLVLRANRLRIDMGQ